MLLLARIVVEPRIDETNDDLLPGETVQERGRGTAAKTVLTVYVLVDPLAARASRARPQAGVHAKVTPCGSGVVDQDVQAAVGGLDCGEALVDGGILGDIQRCNAVAAAPAFDGRSTSLPSMMLATMVFRSRLAFVPLQLLPLYAFLFVNCN